MNEQEARNRMMDYLYNEMDEQERKDFEEFLGKNPELQKELNELKGTRTLLEEVPVDTPAHKLVYLPGSKQSSFTGGLKTLLAVAATLLIAVMLFAFANVQVGQTDAGFYLTMGQQPAVEDAMNEEAVMNLMNQIREENAMLMAAMLDQSREQQNEQLEQVLIQLTNYYDLRREQDLYLIAEGLAQLEEETTYRLFQTNEALSEVIYALSN